MSKTHENPSEEKRLNLTERHLRSAYTYLSMIPPYSKWKMPDEYRVHLSVIKSNRVYGHYDSDPHSIAVSCYQCRNFDDVLRTMAHEMVHLKLERDGDPDHSDHKGKWSESVQEVCSYLGWDAAEF